MKSFALSNTGSRLGLRGPSPPSSGDKNNSQVLLLQHSQLPPPSYQDFPFASAGFPRANGQEEAHNPVHPRQRRKAGCIVRRKLNTNSLRIQAKKKDEQGKGNGDGVLVGCDCNGEVADVLQKSEELARTRQLVETAMLAATAGLAFFITNLLRLEGYIGCFLPLPPVIAALRWNAAAGRKTMVATLLLLFLIGGPLKAVSYVLLHGMLGMVMGGLWSWHVSWTSSLLLCTFVRMLGLILSVAMSSWFIKENLLALLINQAHASLGQLCVFLGINASPSVSLIIMAVCALVFLNCIVFVFLLHVLYAVILHRLGIPSAIEAPGWIKRSLTP
ncbi:hypothetical protein CBR_g18672 [Chara braunii]|uniref:DUF2232 domain-containing protein n=1 Tax=Chara braunii TaxID=69332 RepID=A0A388KW43_CHABU|nr:hypothetical protein CBR_g18672 [Chara braunii]|eukprot:GBG74261.1 hypothetical protein CBR_g18672 [Chara braunii]